jgi:hypothetical protein
MREPGEDTMSNVEREFPMPKQIGNGVMGNAIGAKQLEQQAQLNAYIPERHRDVIENEHGAPASQHEPGRKTNHIKGWLRLLTYREMCEFVGEIFDAHEQLFSKDQSCTGSQVITRDQLCDVFDKIAHGN